MEFGDKMLKQRLALRSNKVKMKFCVHSSGRCLPLENVGLLCTMRGRSPFLHPYFFIGKVQDLQNKEIAFLYKSGSKVSSRFSFIVLPAAL